MSIDVGTRRRLTLALISSYLSRAASTLIQLIQVPFFLHFWSAPLYGEWMILSSVPNYLSFSSTGFGNVAGNEMMMAEARGDRAAALRAFQSCWWLILFTLGLVGSGLALVLNFVPVAPLLNVHNISESDTRWIVFYLGASVLFTQVETLLQSAYRSIGRYSYGSTINTMTTLAAFAASLIPVALGRGPRAAALVFAASEMAGTLVLALMVRRHIPWIRFGWQHARLAEIRRQAAPAFAFMGFPLGQALNLQGTLQAVSYALGPVAVVVFGTTRTVSRVAMQMVQMINFSFEPEFARSYAQRDIGLIRTLHRRACQMALILSVSMVMITIAAGPFLLTHWTHGKVPPSRPLLSILLGVVILFSLWSTSSAMLTATNQHKRLAAVFIGATGAVVVVTWFMAHHFGLYGAAGALLLTELLMNLYVLPATLRIAHDTFPGFLRSLLDVPHALRPKVLLKRLLRSRPVLEV